MGSSQAALISASTDHSPGPGARQQEQEERGPLMLVSIIQVDCGRSSGSCKSGTFCGCWTHMRHMVMNLFEQTPPAHHGRVKHNIDNLTFEKLEPVCNM